jgi:hypothetical protein
MFEDVAEQSGIRFRLTRPSNRPLTVLETAPGGCAFLDYDLDGRLDALLVGDGACALYRNEGPGGFREVSESVGLDRPDRWMGCAVGDIDGDRYPDLLLTGYRCLRLYRNDGGKRFLDVTADSGLRTNAWTTSAAFWDADRDGDLDLYVGAYLQYTEGVEDLCRLGEIRTACGPEHYDEERGAFYVNNGDGRFQEATAQYGFDRASGKTWGVAPADFDGDGWVDVYLANDMMPCDLFRNEKGRRFQNIGPESGTAFDLVGNLLGGMGVDWGDVDADGAPDLLLTTYFLQPMCLYRNQSAGTFREASQGYGLAAPTRPFVGFGCGLIDIDNDTDLDIFTANGHVRSNVDQFDASQHFRQPMQVLRNEGGGRFRDASRWAGPCLSDPIVGRGTAFGDYDADGDLDILVVDLDGPARLLRNNFPEQNWLRVRLEGRRNREGIGARVSVKTSARRWETQVFRARAVLSASEPVAHFGLGSTPGPVDVEVRWADGGRSVRRNVPIRSTIGIKQ